MSDNKRYLNVSTYLEDELKGMLDEDTMKFANQCLYEKSWPYTPRDTGTLAESVDIQADGIHYKEPYANYLNEGKLMVDPETESPWAKKDAKKVLTDTDLNFNREKSPYAAAHWGKFTADLHGDEIAKKVKEYILTKKGI